MDFVKAFLFCNIMEYYKILDLKDIEYFCELDLVWKVEKWKNIVEYNDYLVSDLGRVKSIKNNRQIILKSDINNSGYHRVGLSKNGVVDKKFVHHLCFYSFTNKIKSINLIVDHKDNIKHNNSLLNLQLITHRKNTSKERTNKHSKYNCIIKNSKEEFVLRMWFKNKKYCFGKFKNESLAKEKYDEIIHKLDENKDISNLIISEKIHKNKGVHFDKTNKKWRASHYSKGELKQIGRFSTYNEALDALNNYKSNNNLN